jgi:hypothetical protein
MQVSGDEGAGALAMAVCRLLLTEAESGSFAAHMYELLGDAAVEHLEGLVDKRRSLAGALGLALAKVGAAAVGLWGCGAVGLSEIGLTPAVCMQHPTAHS